MTVPSPGLARSFMRSSEGLTMESITLFKVDFTCLRAAPPAGAGRRQSLAATSDPPDPRRGHARDQREVAYITGHDRTGRHQRPAPDHAAGDDHGARAQ